MVKPPHQLKNLLTKKMKITQTILPTKTKRKLAEKITNEVCTTWGVTMDEMRGRNRSQPLAFARQVAISLCLDMANMSLNEAGKLFNRDHTTAWYAKQRVDEELAKNDPRVREEISQIIRNLK